MKFNMIVVMTSCAPVVARRTPAIPPQIPPPMNAATRQSTTCRAVGSSKVIPTQVAAAAPAINWPLPPMLNSPPLNANATESPAKISGVASVRVSEMARLLPTAPRKSAL